MSNTLVGGTLIEGCGTLRRMSLLEEVGALGSGPWNFYSQVPFPAHSLLHDYRCNVTSCLMILLPWLHAMTYCIPSNAKALLLQPPLVNYLVTTTRNPAKTVNSLLETNACFCGSHVAGSSDGWHHTVPLQAGYCPPCPGTVARPCLALLPWHNRNELQSIAHVPFIPDENSSPLLCNRLNQVPLLQNTSDFSVSGPRCHRECTELMTGISITFVNKYAPWSYLPI